ncbi:MAG: hypothetical protein WKF88_05920 [Ferruginibacter sp.]
MKLPALLALSFLTITACAQRTDVRNGMIFTDGKPYALINRDNCGVFGKCRVTLSALDGRTAVIISFNPQSFGGHTYARMHFIKSNKYARLEDLPTKESKVAKKVVKAGLFKNGELDEAAAATFMAANPE